MSENQFVPKCPIETLMTRPNRISITRNKQRASYSDLSSMTMAHLSTCDINLIGRKLIITKLENPEEERYECNLGGNFSLGYVRGISPALQIIDIAYDIAEHKERGVLAAKKVVRAYNRTVPQEQHLPS